LVIGYAGISTENQSLDVQEQIVQEYMKNEGEEYIIYRENKVKVRLIGKN